MKKILTYFIQGIAILVPVIVTIYIILKIFSIFVDFFVWIGITGNMFLDVVLGLTTMFLIIIGIGILASNYFFGNIMHYFEHQFEKLPIVRHIYSPIKDFTEAFVGNKKKFKYPVLVQTSSHNNYKEIGFITQKDLSNLKLDDYVVVYIPFSYSLAGKMILIKKEFIEPLDQNPTDIMKFIISGGIYDLENRQKD